MSHLPRAGARSVAAVGSGRGPGTGFSASLSAAARASAIGPNRARRAFTSAATWSARPALTASAAFATCLLYSAYSAAALPSASVGASPPRAAARA